MKSEPGVKLVFARAGSFPTTARLLRKKRVKCFGLLVSLSIALTADHLKKLIYTSRVVRESLSADLIERLIADILEITEGLMSTSPPALFDPTSNEVAFTSPSNFRSLPPHTTPKPSDQHAKFTTAIASTFIHLEHFIASLLFLIFLAAPRGVISSALPRNVHFPYLSRLLPHSSNVNGVADEKPRNPAGSEGLSTMAAVTSTIGVHQPDQVHGHPDQSKFADGAQGSGSELGQRCVRLLHLCSPSDVFPSTYAKQC